MYSVTLENKGDSKYYASSKDASIVIDPEGHGISPLDTLLAALGACAGVYLKYFSKKNPLTFKEFTVKVDGELAGDRPARFKEIKLNIIPKGGSLDEETKLKLIEFIKQCPVHNTLKTNPEITIKVS